MAPSTKKEIIKSITLVVIVAMMTLVISQCSVSSASATAETQNRVTVEQLSLNKQGQPRVKVTTDRKRIALLFGEPNSDYTEDDLVFQTAGTKVYTLPAVKRGATVKWFVNAYNPAKGTELFNGSYTWQRPVAVTSTSWTATFTWTDIANPLKGCPQGRVYTFALQEREGVSYLTAKSPLKLWLKRADGTVVTRSVELAFGDGDLAWMPRVGAKTRLTKATVSASGKGNLPVQFADFTCAGT